MRVVPGDRLDANTAQTPGMDRKAAINFARVGAQKLWAGTVHIHPNAKTGAHHHGPLESVIYVVQGARACAGASGSSSPPRPDRATSSTCRRTCRTRRSTPAPTEVLECVLVRSDGEAVAVNLDIEPVEKPEYGAVDRPDPPCVSLRRSKQTPSTSTSDYSLRPQRARVHAGDDHMPRKPSASPPVRGCKKISSPRNAVRAKPRQASRTQPDAAPTADAAAAILRAPR